MRSWTGVSGGAVAIALAALGGCGQEAPPQPSGAPMSVERSADEPNHAPVVERVSIEPMRPVAGDELRARVVARDPDGDRLELRHVWSVGGQPAGAEGAELVLRSAAKGDLIEVTVTASDGEAESEPRTARARVANQPPHVVEVTIHPQGLTRRGEEVRVRAEARDPDGDAVELRYAWRVNGRSVQRSGAALDTSTLRPGDAIQAEVWADDGEDRSERVHTAPVRIANAAPEIVSRPGAMAPDGVFRYQVEARDPDGDRRLRYSLRAAPEGMQVDPVLGEVTWQPSFQDAGAHQVEVVVRDSEGAATIQAFELQVAEVLEPPESLPASPAE